MLKALFIEDSTEDAELLERELEQSGFDVDTLRVDRPEALREALATQSWDLILADHSGPHIDSTKALAIVREHDADVPFIIVSGTISEDVAIEAMKAGASDFLSKGRLAKLAPVVERELRQAEERRTRRRLEAEGREREQRAALELALAYDATLEGWARALELRDSETEGHSRRVAALTDQLALALGVPDEARVHMHRGALLHDIGKMAVPDGILLKPGSLNEREWDILRQHPTHAVDLLSPIEYLRPALDIPKFHHERWDGSGYPYGLAGEDIPLAARIFAVADVWDALAHARPYRRAWSETEVMRHLESLAGSHLDPRVVDVFLTLVREGRVRLASDPPVDPTTVLVIDASESNRVLVCRSLERDGHCVLMADTGPRALEMLARESADLIVFDSAVPGPAEAAMCARLKKAAAGAPVILVAGVRLDDEAAARAACDDVLIKPAAATTLKSTVRRLLEERRGELSSDRGARI